MEQQKYYGVGHFLKNLIIWVSVGAAIQFIPVIGKWIAYIIWILSIPYAMGSVKVENEELAYKNSYEREISKDIEPSNYYKILIKSGFSNNNLIYNFWRIKDNLYFFPNEGNDVSLKERENFKLHTLNINNIEFYTTKGDIYSETLVSGGGGGGVSISGAIIGGAIAGPVGAVIGGRKKVNKIASETLTHDNRVIYLYYKVDEQIKIIEIQNSHYNALLDLIPENEYEYVLTHQKSNA